MIPHGTHMAYQYSYLRSIHRLILRRNFNGPFCSITTRRSAVTQPSCQMVQVLQQTIADATLTRFCFRLLAEYTAVYTLNRLVFSLHFSR